MMTLVVERLRATCMPPLLLVDSAIEYAALQAPPPAARQPAAYVLPTGTRPGPNAVATTVRQRVEESVAVVLIDSNLRDYRGGQAAADLGALLAAVRTALVGWTPATGWEQTLLGPGRLLSFAGGVVAWQETFTSAHLLRAA
jgi:hypothetical protein